MIREIKFRAWDILSKRMMEDIELWLIPYGVLFPHTPDQRCLELMQFTGLLDKNGKEIYEGDVVRYITRSYGGFSDVDVTVTGKVYFDYGSFEIKVIYKEPPRLVNNLSKLNYKYSIEVIGNIYENPELLEALG
jgi:uncharacterized phage protein (TIGR01671 family)